MKERFPHCKTDADLKKLSEGQLEIDENVILRVSHTASPKNSTSASSRRKSSSNKKGKRRNNRKR